MGTGGGSLRPSGSQGMTASSLTNGGCSGFLPKSPCFQYAKPAPRCVDSSKVWDSWRADPIRRTARIPRSTPARMQVRRALRVGLSAGTERDSGMVVVLDVDNGRGTASLTRTLVLWRWAGLDSACGRNHRELDRI